MTAGIFILLIDRKHHSFSMAGEQLNNMSDLVHK